MVSNSHAARLGGAAVSTALYITHFYYFIIIVFLSLSLCCLSKIFLCLPTWLYFTFFLLFFPSTLAVQRRERGCVWCWLPAGFKPRQPSNKQIKSSQHHISLPLYCCFSLLFGCKAQDSVILNHTVLGPQILVDTWRTNIISKS